MKKLKRQILPALCCLVAALMFSGCLSGEGTYPAEEKTPENGADPVSQAPLSAPEGVQLPPPDSVSLDESEVASAANGKYTLVVPEGFTLPKIGMRLEEMGVCTAQEFVDQTQSGAYADFWAFENRADNVNRCFDLEGYLFPATYEFAEDASLDDIIKDMLNATKNRLNRQDVMDQVKESGYLLSEILTLASIIQKESYGDESMPLISSVLHNRLAVGQKIECDVTISYVENVIKPFITGDENRYNEFYNTYKCPALPAGPICNPGMAAIEAALNPAQTDYYYFLTDANNNFYYATTYEEHQANEVAAGLK